MGLNNVKPPIQNSRSTLSLMNLPRESSKPAIFDPWSLLWQCVHLLGASIIGDNNSREADGHPRVVSLA